MIATAAMLGLIAIGSYVGLRPDADDPTGWFVGAGVAFAAAVFVPGFVFVIHPLVVRLDARRSKILAEARSVTNPATPAESRIEPAPEEQPRLLILDASYGAFVHSVDVGDVLREQIIDNALDVLVSNEIFGGDPLPGVKKELTVWYAFGGPVQLTSFVEGTRAVLPPPAGSVDQFDDLED